MKSFRNMIWAILGTLTLGSTLFAGPDWVEGRDAGSFLQTAQVVRKASVSLVLIEGALTGLSRSGGGGDFEDMYIIRITDPSSFSAKTIAPGGTDFNTQLWLFRIDMTDPTAAFGLLANDDEQDNPSGGSELTSVATDGTGQTIPGAGLYALAITGFNNDPTSATGLIFEQASLTEVSGPDGPGANKSHNGWNVEPGGAPETGSYLISLTGAAPAEQIVPAVSEWGLVIMALLSFAAGTILIGRRRLAQPSR